MATTRNYQAEYQRRIANAAKRGLSRSQARGHARSIESPVRAQPFITDQKLEAALKLLRQTGRQAAAAKQAGVAPERFRRFLRHNSLAQRTGRLWQITDNRPRRMTVITEGDSKELTLDGFEQASLNGQHSAAVGAFLNSNDIDLLRPFEGRSVRDVHGKMHPLETDPNRLHRMAAQGDEVFHEIYRLII
ncbi:MAG: hypothetical protein ABIO85_00985 [Sphingomicrobium sp.]